MNPADNITNVLNNILKSLRLFWNLYFHFKTTDFLQLKIQLKFNLVEIKVPI